MTSDQSTPSSPSRRSLWMRLLGLRYRPNRRLRIVPNWWGMTLIVMVLGLGTLVGFAEYSMQPDFCRSCHLMEPYYEAWHQSTHKNVPCADCHFEPGWRNTLKGKWQASSQAAKYLTNTYGSKPHAEIRDASCLRSGCHDHRLLQGKVNWTVKTQRGDEITIRFDHTPHLTEMRRGKKLRCVSCHSQMVQGQHIVVTLDTCFLCHFKGMKHGRDDQTLGGCQSCHEAPKNTIRLTTGQFNHSAYVERGVKCQNCHSDSVWGDGAVPKQFCWTCHNDTEHLMHYGDSALMHKAHVTDAKVECANCHIQIVHNLTAALPDDAAGPINTAHALNSTSGCGQCHTAMHDGAMLLYRGVGGRGVADTPSAMFRAQVDCIGCHQTPAKTGAVAEFVGQSYRTQQASCDMCHGKKYEGRLDEWKTQCQTQLAEADKAYAEADEALRAAKLNDVKRLSLRRMLDDAHHNIELVRYGRGVHNFTYATALLNVAMTNSREVTRQTTGQSETAP